MADYIFSQGEVNQKSLPDFVGITTCESHRETVSFFLSIVFSLNSQAKLFVLTQTCIVEYVLCFRAHDLCVRPGPQGTFDTIWHLSNVGNHTT